MVYFKILHIKHVLKKKRVKGSVINNELKLEIS